VTSFDSSINPAIQHNITSHEISGWGLREALQEYFSLDRSGLRTAVQTSM
jgi:hypothetical protein